MLVVSTAEAAQPPRRLNTKERALWMLQRLVPESGVFNEGLAFRVDGHLDTERLQRQLTRLAARHPALRTMYPEVQQEPVGLVLVAEHVPVRLALREPPAEPTDAELSAFVGQPFDITSEPPVRVALWRFPGGDLCCMSLHHLAYDAWTAGVLADELVAGYNGDLAGTQGPVEVVPAVEEPLPEPEDLAYWRASLTDFDRRAQRMNLGREDVRGRTFDGAVRRHKLSPRAVSAVSALAARLRVTDNIVLLAAYSLLLARHGAGPDLVVGVAVDVREEADRYAAGYHVNNLPVRLRVDLAEPFSALVATARDVMLGGLRHRNVPYEAVTPDLRAGQPGWHAPLFRYVFNFLPNPVSGNALMDGMRTRWRRIDSPHSRQDLEFVVEKERGETLIKVTYSTELFGDDDVRAFQERFDELLTGLAAAPDQPLGEIGWWSDSDRVTLTPANAATRPAPVPTVPAMIAAQRSDGIALVADSGAHSYADLLASAHGVRRSLSDAGVQPGDVVALYGERSASLAAAVLGIWAAGAAYLPLGTDHPVASLERQLSLAGAAALLADEFPAELKPPCSVLPLTGGSEETGQRPLPIPEPGDLAYVIYTSGSTGPPKGVEISHGNLANQVGHFATALDFTSADAMLWLSSFTFDISTLELMLPLCTGGRLVVAPDEARADGALLAELIDAHRVRIVQATPTTWSLLSEEALAALRNRVVLCGGEPLPAPLANRLLAAGAQLHNVYGPTETTIWSTTAELTAPVSDPVPVGVPVSGTRIFVSDPEGRPLPPGLAGEVCIAGAGVALGYRDRPDLTAQRFARSAEFGRYYRTGDIGRWRYDGTLEVRGRADRQVKIRGHRLELGEVESVLRSHPAVIGAAVLLADTASGHQLVAYVQAAGPGDLAEEVWRHATRSLPPHALPTRIILGPLPVTVNGKIDYAALAARPVTAGVSRAPAGEDELQQRLLGLWRDLLDDVALGPDDHFFLSGGHSLLAVRLLARVAELTGIQLPLEDLLDAPTVTTFAARLRSEDPDHDD